MGSKLQFLQELDRFCCSDYNRRRINLITTAQQEKKIERQELFRTKLPDFIQDFSHTQITSAQISFHLNHLYSLQDFIDQIADDPDQRETPLSEIKKNRLCTAEDSQNILQLANSLGSRYQTSIPELKGIKPEKTTTHLAKTELFSFHEEIYITIYRKLKDFSKEYNKSDPIPDSEQSLQTSFQEMLLAFQLVYHQIQFGYLYTHPPLIFSAFVEAITEFFELYKSFEPVNSQKEQELIKNVIFSLEALKQEWDETTGSASATISIRKNGEILEEYLPIKELLDILR